MWFRKKRSEPTPAEEQLLFRKYQAVTLSGRRFLESNYVLPKDAQEISRLDFQHYLLRQAFKGNYLAPINDPQYILDVGAGTGRWGKEMAASFPKSHVMSMDIERASSTGPIPTNYTYALGNILEHLPVRSQTFHFVHQRLLVAAIPAERWPSVIRELVRVTRPGGWLELIECGMDTLNPGPLTTQFFQWGLEASLPRGLDPRVIPNLDTQLRENGLYDVKKGHVDIPIGPWGGRLGIMMQEDLLSGFSGLEALYTQTGTTEEFHDIIRKLPEEWESKHTSYRFYSFYGHK